MGVYSFMEKLKRGEDRIDVESLGLRDNSEPEVGGGYILKRDRLDPGDLGLNAGGEKLAMVYPKESVITAAQAEWISTLHAGWAWGMYRPDQRMERLIATASLDQRAVLGFPQPGSDYWCPETIAAVEARYGPLGFDAGPYRDAPR